MKEGLAGDGLGLVIGGASLRRLAVVLHAGLGLSRRRIDVCLLSDRGELVERTVAPPDIEALRGLVGRLARHRQPVRAVIESMNGARFVHDTLAELGWEVLVADAHKVKGL
jgi:hypothetical protein